MAKELVYEYTRTSGERVECSRDGRDFVVRIDGQEVGRNRMTVRRGQTAVAVALEHAKKWQRDDEAYTRTVSG